MLLLAVHSCRDECPVEPDPDPCQAYPASFDILTLTTKRSYCIGDPSVKIGDFELYGYDTFVAGPFFVQFATNFEYDSVKWQFGSDPTIYHQNKQVMDFLGYEGKILATCIGWRAANTSCFGIDDDGVDTLTREITFLNLNDAPTYGRFKGTNDGELDSFVVYFGRDTIWDSNGEHYRDFFQGLPQNSTWKTQEITFGWFTRKGGGGPGGFTGDGLSICNFEAIIDRNNSDLVTIHWMTKDKTTRIFRGKRIK